MKVFITKYALSDGINEADMTYTEASENRKKQCIGKYKGYHNYFYGDEVHLTKEEAIKDAEKRRLKMIESLKKQIAKLEKLNFNQ